MGRLGLEPRTYRLKAEYSTIELATLLYSILTQFYCIIQNIRVKYKNLFIFLVKSYILIGVELYIKGVNYMFNIQVFAQLVASAVILLAGPIVILLLALRKGNL